MAVLSQPNHPARLAALFAASLGACAVMALAIYAGAWTWRDLRHGGAPPARVSSKLQDNIETPDGITVVIPVTTSDEFEALAGFAPLVPERVPASTDATPKYAVTQPDADGRRGGRVAFSARPDAAVDGITGPVVVIAQAQGRPGLGVDGALKQQAGAGRALFATLACGDLVLDVQLYFSPDASPGETVITPHMLDLGAGFIGEIKEQCAGR